MLLKNLKICFKLVIKFRISEQGLADDRMLVISLMALTSSMAVHLPFQNSDMASRHFAPI